MITAVKAALCRSILSSSEVEAWIRRYFNFEKKGIYPDETYASIVKIAFIR